MNRGGRGIFAAGGIAVAFGVYLVAAGGAVFLAPLLSSTVPVTRPAGTAVTTTRSGTADGLNASNIVETVATNTGFYHSTKGLQSMAAHVELATFSYAFDNAAWLKTNVTVTANADSGPFSGVAAGAEAERIQSSAASHNISQDITVTASTNYVLYFWAKNNGGTRAAYSIRDNTGAADILAATSYFSNLNGSTYALIAVPFTTPVGCISVKVYPVRDGTAGTDVFLTGAHLVLATSPSGVPCPRVDATARTCNADVHTVPTTGWPTGSGEVSFVVTPLSGTAPSAASAIIDTRTTTTTQGYVLWRDTSNRLQFQAYAGAQVCTNTSAALTWTAGTAKTIEARWTPTSCEIWADGVLIDSDPATGSPASLGATAKLGSDVVGASFFNGWLATGCTGRACP